MRSQSSVKTKYAIPQYSLYYLNLLRLSRTMQNISARLSSIEKALIKIEVQSNYANCTAFNYA